MVQGPELAPCQPSPGECALAGVEIIPLEESHSSLPGDRNRSLADHSSTSILLRAATPAGNVEETRVEPFASHHYQILQSPGHVEQLQPISDIDAEVIRILQLGRNAYPGLLGFGDILIPSAPLLYFFASILAGVDFVVLLTHQILYFFILLPVFSSLHHLRLLFKTMPRKKTGRSCRWVWARHRFSCVRHKCSKMGSSLLYSARLASRIPLRAPDHDLSVLGCFQAVLAPSALPPGTCGKLLDTAVWHLAYCSQGALSRFDHAARFMSNTLFSSSDNLYTEAWTLVNLETEIGPSEMSLFLLCQI